MSLDQDSLDSLKIDRGAEPRGRSGIRVLGTVILAVVAVGAVTLFWPGQKAVSQGSSTDRVHLPLGPAS